MPDALAIVGPTSSGKTALSVEVARRLDGEVVSMDSRSVYRGMDIGTAKPTAEERGDIPHHGIDIADPSERFNAARWARYAREKIAEIRGRGRVPMLVGGTGFFLRALTDPIFREPELDPARRAELSRELEALPDEELHRRLAEVDPESAARLRDWGGRQRLLRALEVPLLTGKPLPWWHRNSPPEAPGVPVLAFVLDVPRERVYATVNARVDGMVDAGLIDEVRGLVAKYGEDAPGLNAHGYAELIPYLRGERTLDEALELVRKNTRAYTKRQQTWNRTQLPAGAIHVDATRPRAELADEIAAAWRAAVGPQGGAAGTPDPGSSHPGSAGGV
ncbi:tRNA (adenosine(37)-N6)-dimethylallyltransferase MiaA [Longimicrobium sp.]|uniref:tRNA (adenosine(37)-N6)-dimethylallyltransferase MiaA n=1 Tax=Longimicrobium sp. TaxID=2029185 RepID=UPI002BD545F5|nr:tRNA (adenosine(37)-N6)-dimethylallyltransferase MiaA [Longimicrobium sp.]HSU16329.1 tRNA (adenosine(37)-N6)-dimethylallyltransferase MiaA [Longimicrobium sp.]